MKVVDKHICVSCQNFKLVQFDHGKGEYVCPKNTHDYSCHEEEKK